MDMPAGIVSGLKSLQGGLASSVSPSAPFVLRRPVTRNLRMARSEVTLVRASAVPSNATGARFSAIHQVDPVTPAIANASTGSESNPSTASGPGAIHFAKAVHEASASRADNFQSGPDASEPDVAGSDASSPGTFVPVQVSAATAGGQKKKAVAEGSPGDDYALALKSYQDGRHALARELFAAFIQDYPRHKLLPNALYWTGETWYAQGRYERAVQAFAQVVQSYPRHAKSPDALLKQAYAAMRQGRMDQARTYLDRLEGSYPNSQASRLGRQARSKLQGRNEFEMLVMACG